MTIEFSPAQFMASAGGTAFGVVRVAGRVEEVPWGRARAGNRTGLLHLPASRCLQSLGDIPVGLCDPVSANGCDVGPRTAG